MVSRKSRLEGRRAPFVPWQTRANALCMVIDIDLRLVGVVPPAPLQIHAPCKNHADVCAACIGCMFYISVSCSKMEPRVSWFTAIYVELACPKTRPRISLRKCETCCDNGVQRRRRRGSHSSADPPMSRDKNRRGTQGVRSFLHTQSSVQ